MRGVDFVTYDVIEFVFQFVFVHTTILPSQKKVTVLRYQFRRLVMIV